MSAQYVVVKHVVALQSAKVQSSQIINIPPAFWKLPCVAYSTSLLSVVKTRANDVYRYTFQTSNSRKQVCIKVLNIYVTFIYDTCNRDFKTDGTGNCYLGLQFLGAPVVT